MSRRTSPPGGFITGSALSPFGYIPHQLRHHAAERIIAVYTKVATPKIGAAAQTVKKPRRVCATGANKVQKYFLPAACTSTKILRLANVRREAVRRAATFQTRAQRSGFSFERACQKCFFDTLSSSLSNPELLLLFCSRRSRSIRGSVSGCYSVIPFPASSVLLKVLPMWLYIFAIFHYNLPKNRNLSGGKPYVIPSCLSCLRV